MGLKLGPPFHTKNTEGVENRVLKIVLGRKNEEVTGEMRKLHNEKFVMLTLL
jgi:hypothetical protein